MKRKGKKKRRSESVKKRKRQREKRVFMQKKKLSLAMFFTTLIRFMSVRFSLKPLILVHAKHKSYSALSKAGCCDGNACLPVLVGGVAELN